MSRFTSFPLAKPFFAVLFVTFAFGACANDSPVPSRTASGPLAPAAPEDDCEEPLASEAEDAFGDSAEQQALAKCGNILNDVEKGKLEEATEKLLHLIEWASNHSSEIEDENALIAFIEGLAGAIGVDLQAQLVTGEDTVTVPSNHAAAEFDSGDLSGPVVVIITLMNGPDFPGDCVPGHGSDLRPGNACYPQFYDLTVIPEDNVVDDVVFGLCLIDDTSNPLAANEDINPGILNRIRLAAPDPANPGEIIVFPLATAPPTVSCTNNITYMEDGWRKDVWEWLGPFHGIFSVTPAYANPGPLGASVSVFTPKIPTDTLATVVKGWDSSRGGFSSLASSNVMSGARNATTTFLANEGLSTTIGETDEITGPALAGASIVVLGTVKTNSGPITALSSDEQNALESFVDNGGCAILMADNDSFGGANTDTINESLIDPFGFDVTGTLSGSRTSTTTSAASTVINGVTTIAHNFPGRFDGLNGATVLANLDDNSQPSAIELAYGKGRVIAFSDANQFFDASGAGRFGVADNATLFENSLAACLE